MADDSESLPKGFSTMHLDHPDGDMQVVLIMVVTVSNTEGGKAEMIEKLKKLRFNGTRVALKWESSAWDLSGT